MTALRALQRTLFRMQADASFARRILDGDLEAVATTGLDPEDLALIKDVDPAGLSADPGSKRRAQLLGNLALEYAAALAFAARGGTLALEHFLTSAAFHDAIANDRALPHVFGNWLSSAREDAPEWSALVRLETQLCHARRATSVRVMPGPGELVLAAGARCLELPAGTLDLAEALKGAERPRDAALPSVDAERSETALVTASPRAHPFALAELQVELLAPPADALLRRAERPLTRADREHFAREQGATTAALETFLAEFVSEGVLIAG